jgi:thiamine biosynthesis lipoprotein
LRLHRVAFAAMGCPCEVQLFTESAEHAARAAERAIADVRRLDARYSRYRPDSFMSEVNRAAEAGGELSVDPETGSLLDYADACHRASDGLFDVTSGVLRRAWRFESGSLPSAALLESLLPKVGWHSVRWKRPVLAFPVRGMELDLDGIVKEYAVDRAVALCRDTGVSRGFVNLGGDMRVIGPRPDGAPWRIGIRHPRRQDALLRTVSLHDGALASSGDYERGIEHAGVRYGHIVDPRTGWPVRHMAAVTVLADLCTVAGSASTIAMLEDEDGPAWLEDTGLPHLWVDVEGKAGGSWGQGVPPGLT